MRAGTLLIIAVLVFPSLALAQTKNTAPPKGGSTKSAAPGKGSAAPATPRSSEDMDRLLRAWETKSRGVRDVDCEFRRITKDVLFKTEEVEFGKAMGIKPYQGRLDLMDANGQFTQIFIYTGKKLHQYDFKSKQEIIHILPDFDPAVGQATMPGPLGFVYGMSATEAKARFEMKLIREFSKDSVDYAEIHATPRSQIDQQDFKFAQLVVDKRNYLPKELRIIEPNGNEQHWIFDRLETNLNPPVSAKDLEPFDRRKYKELEKWKQVMNNLGEPRKSTDTAKPKGGGGSPAKPEASRNSPTKK